MFCAQMVLPLFWNRYYPFNRVSQHLYEATCPEFTKDWLHNTFWSLLLSLPMWGFLGDRCRARKLIFTVSTAVVFLTTLAPVLPLVVYFPTCLANESDAHESSINQASHHSQEYLEGISNTPGDVSIV